MERLAEARHKQQEKHKKRQEEEIEKESRKQLQAFDYKDPEFNKPPYPCAPESFPDHTVFQCAHMLAATISWHMKEAQKAWFYLIP